VGRLRAFRERWTPIREGGGNQKEDKANYGKSLVFRYKPE
jgi:hypothetical protein